MRRAAALLSAFLIIICMAVPARADSSAAGLDYRATVEKTGVCHVTVLLNLHLETIQEGLTFPVPSNAYDISVNGVNPSTSRNGSVLLLDLSRILGNVAGDFSVSISYSIPNAVKETSNGVLQLNLPILCGLTLPIDRTTFTVVLPQAMETRPIFTSTYYQTRIEEDMTLEIADNQFRGTIHTRILGSDWLNMTLQVDEEVFPQRKRVIWILDIPDLSMLVLAVLAVVYWIMFMRCLPPRAIRHTTGPDGVSAGDVGHTLTSAHPDLNALVLHWAQLGYILIQLDDSGRVLLHKRMTMGNERSLQEGRIFRTLFGNKTLVDGTGIRYATLAQKVAAGKPGIQGLYQRGSGNPLVFRLFVTLIGMFAGISIGSSLGEGTAFKDLLAVLLGMFGLISAWVMQEGFKYMHLRNKLPLFISLGLWPVWILLGHLALEPIVATSVFTAQLLAGMAAAYGGRRTELGKQSVQQILGLRRFMKSVSRDELQRILTVNPEYFHTLAPYAIALGVEKQFAKRFGNLRIPACPYLTAGRDGHLTATEWAQRLRTVVEAMEDRQTQLFLNRLMGR